MFTYHGPVLNFKERWEKNPAVVVITTVLTLGGLLLGIWKELHPSPGQSQTVNAPGNGNTTITQGSGSTYNAAQAVPSHDSDTGAKGVPPGFHSFPLSDGSPPTEAQRSEIHALHQNFLAAHKGGAPADSPVEPAWINLELEKMRKPWRVSRRNYGKAGAYVDRGVNDVGVNGNYIQGDNTSALVNNGQINRMDHNELVVITGPKRH